MRASQLVRTKAKVPTLFLNPATLISEQNYWSNRDPPPWESWEVSIFCRNVRLGERKSVNFPIRACRVWAKVPRDQWERGDRKSLDEGAHYGGERWEEVRVAEYQVPGTEYGVTHIGLHSTKYTV